ncbi:ecdysteroid-regulated 16 kDa protein-like [Colias croceus]|uniref:ecdysteroid-regulated 16 kDa protein-like n=1 Tax=Colias crocea TaxID=72248 RepID=UPI001E27C61A|nr:ecdysteroid-regulated 16 kDa protein-like [Colias croceus]
MLFYFFTAVLLSSAHAKFYKDCGSKLATVQDVGITGCAPDAKECVLKRNTNATISIDFTPNMDVKAIDTVVHGVIMNLPVPFPMPNPDACKDEGLTCPIKSGEKQAYRATLPVLKSYPKVKVDVKWELKSDEGDLVCIMIPAKIN